jgi:hypothetical protein
MPSGVTQFSASTLPPGADLAAAFSSLRGGGLVNSGLGVMRIVLWARPLPAQRRNLTSFIIIDKEFAKA